MKKFLVSTAAAVGMLVGAASAAKAEWIAVAMNYHGSGFSGGYSEEDARDRAIGACENRTARDCGWTTTSVPDSWYLVGLYCNGQPTTAGSRHGYYQAKINAANKVGASVSRCRTVWEK